VDARNATVSLRDQILRLLDSLAGLIPSASPILLVHASQQLLHAFVTLARTCLTGQLVVTGPAASDVEPRSPQAGVTTVIASVRAFALAHSQRVGDIPVSSNGAQITDATATASVTPKRVASTVALPPPILTMSAHAGPSPVLVSVPSSASTTGPHSSTDVELPAADRLLTVVAQHLLGLLERLHQHMIPVTASTSDHPTVSSSSPSSLSSSTSPLDPSVLINTVSLAYGLQFSPNRDIALLAASLFDVLVSHVRLSSTTSAPNGTTANPETAPAVSANIGLFSPVMSLSAAAALPVADRFFGWTSEMLQVLKYDAESICSCHGALNQDDAQSADQHRSSARASDAEVERMLKTKGPAKAFHNFTTTSAAHTHDRSSPERAWSFLCGSRVIHAACSVAQATSITRCPDDERTRLGANRLCHTLRDIVMSTMISVDRTESSMEALQLLWTTIAAVSRMHDTVTGPLCLSTVAAELLTVAEEQCKLRCPSPLLLRVLSLIVPHLNFSSSSSVDQGVISTSSPTAQSSNPALHQTLRLFSLCLQVCNMLLR